MYDKACNVESYMKMVKVSIMPTTKINFKCVNKIASMNAVVVLTVGTFCEPSIKKKTFNIKI